MLIIIIIIIILRSEVYNLSKLERQHLKNIICVIVFDPNNHVIFGNLSYTDYITIYYNSKLHNKLISRLWNELKFLVWVNLEYQFSRHFTAVLCQNKMAPINLIIGKNSDQKSNFYTYEYTNRGQSDPFSVLNRRAHGFDKISGRGVI